MVVWAALCERGGRCVLRRYEFADDAVAAEVLSVTLGRVNATGVFAEVFDDQDVGGVGTPRRSCVRPLSADEGKTVDLEIVHSRNPVKWLLGRASSRGAAQAVSLDGCG